MKKTVLILLSLLVLSCSSKLEPSLLEVTDIDHDTLQIPSNCQRHYNKNERYVVAVVEFENNTTYTDAKVQSGGSSTVGVSGVAYNDNAAIAVGASGTNFENVSKQIYPKLGEYAQGSVEAVVVERGGADVLSRNQITKILQEQKFQMTISDPNTAVELGRLMGAQFIITGSVDNIGIKHKQQSNMGNSQDGIFGFALSVIDIFSNADAGWHVEAELTITIIDVATSKIIGTRQSTGYAYMGQSTNFTSDQVIAGAKKAMSDSINSSVDIIISTFPLQGYVNELRGGKQAALLNIGYSDGIREGDKFYAYEMVSNRDFISGKDECVLSRLPIELTISDHIESNSAWASVNTTDKTMLNMLKIGTVVRRAQ